MTQKSIHLKKILEEDLETVDEKIKEEEIKNGIPRRFKKRRRIKGLNDFTESSLDIHSVSED